MPKNNCGAIFFGVVEAGDPARTLDGRGRTTDALGTTDAEGRTDGRTDVFFYNLFRELRTIKPVRTVRPTRPTLIRVLSNLAKLTPTSN